MELMLRSARFTKTPLKVLARLFGLMLAGMIATAAAATLCFAPNGYGSQIATLFKRQTGRNLERGDR
jgi:hypothetical protein